MMPDKQTIDRAREDKRRGRSAGTQASEFIRDEIHKIRRGEHGARSTKQAIAIGLSEARRAGVNLPPRHAERLPLEPAKTPSVHGKWARAGESRAHHPPNDQKQ